MLKMSVAQQRRGGDRPFAHWPEYYTYGINQTSKRCLPLHSCTLMSHPAIRRFQDHLRVRAGPLDLQPQRHRVVDDPHRRELLPGFRLPYDHRPPPMQINPDELLAVILSIGASRGSCKVNTPSIRRERHEERRPRPFIAST